MSESIKSPISPVGPTPPPKSPIQETFRSASQPPNPAGRSAAGGRVITIPIVDSTALPPRSVSLAGHTRVSQHPIPQEIGRRRGKGPAPPLRLNPQTTRAAGPSSLSPLQLNSPASPHPGMSSTAAADSAFSSARKKMEESDREAMRKLRSTLLDTRSTGSAEGSSSSGTQSPLSPIFRVPSTSSSGHRASGLAKVVPPITDDVGEQDQEEDQADVEIDFRIAVIGHQGCGKTTFIKKALKSSGITERAVGSVLLDTATASYVSYVPAGGKIRYSWMAEFLEVDMLRLADQPSSLAASTSSTSSASPDRSGVSKILSEVSGVILCYDVQRAESFAGIPELLEIVNRKSLPAVLIGCKSDADATLKVNPGDANAIAQPYNIGLIEVTKKTTDGQGKMKNGVRWLVFKLEQRIRRAERRALAGSSTETSHSKPTHRNPRVTSYDSSTDGTLSTGDDHILYRTNQLAITTDPIDPPNEVQMSADWIAKGPLSASFQQPDSPVSPVSPNRPLRPLSEQSNGGSAHVDNQDLEASTAQPDARQVASNTTGGHNGLMPPPAIATGPPLYSSLDDLSNRLFASILAAEEDAFVAAFFMTYRRFLSPTDLMQDFLDHFRDIRKYTISKDFKNWALSKMTGALILWTSTYPVDLAEEPAQALFRECLALILRYPVVAHLVQALVDMEESLYDIDDLDASWSLRPQSSSSSAPDPSVPITPASELMIDPDTVYDYDSVRSGSAIMQKDGSASTRSFSTSSLALEDSSAAAQSGSFRTSSDPRLGVVPENIPFPGDIDGGRWGTASVLITHMQPDRFAMELTRLQWEVFYGIRARDVLRHDIGKERDTPIATSITFFNHLSRFVSTLILANPKPKHRARMYEKFMAIVSALRRMRNYDSMCAVLAGMQEVSILRMTQTMTMLMPTDAMAREWKSNKTLMDPRGGYAPYRGAIKADLDQGKPAIPLLTALLSMVSRLNAVRAADIREDGAVQWDKFAKFGEYLSIIPDFQRRGPPIPGEASSTFRAMLEDTPIITNEDGLYERSKLLEPGGAGPSGRNMLRRLKMV